MSVGIWTSAFIVFLKTAEDWDKKPEMNLESYTKKGACKSLALELLHLNPLKIMFCIYHILKQGEFQTVVATQIRNVDLHPSTFKIK